MKILPSLIRSHHFLRPAILIFVSSTVSVLSLILKQPVPSLFPLSTLNLTITVTMYYNLPKSQINSLQQIQNCLARTVVKAPKSSHIISISSDLCNGSRLMNALNSCHSPTKFLQPANLTTYTILSLFSLQVELALRLLSP